jgi:hypothetical protein
MIAPTLYPEVLLQDMHLPINGSEFCHDKKKCLPTIMVQAIITWRQ